MTERWPTYLIFLPVFLGAGLFVYRRLLRLFHYFQQDEYDSTRFLHWCLAKRAFDRRGSIIALAGMVVAAGGARYQWPWLASAAANVAFGACFVLVALKLEEDPRTKAKKKLSLTPRARRLLSVAIGMLLVITAAIWAFSLLHRPAQPLVLWASILVLFQALPLVIVAAERALSLDEARRQARFEAQAYARFRTVHPLTIGITGSYGKTTTKTILASLLRSSNPVFAPPLSINTRMGITRQIREQLLDNDRYAVIEMGAYQQGSIQRLCNLVPPNAAIITAVGVMHMERFKSRENVLKAKAELAAALPADGILWINGNDEFARRVPSVVQTVQPRFYGLVREKNGEGLDCSAEIRSITPSGTQLDLRWEGRTYSLLLNLWGDPLVENFVGAFAMAASLGLDPDVLCAAALNLKPTDHRLQVTRRGKRLFIDDAYNSNPIGFAAALDVLHSLPVTQRILVTPGMVELGTLQASENELAAKKAAGICEMIVIVGHTNAAALRAGAMAVESPCPVQIHEVSTPDEAFALINSLAHAEAGVLIENDLPDLYETSPRL